MLDKIHGGRLYACEGGGGAKGDPIDTQGAVLVNFPPRLIVHPTLAKIEPEAQYLISNFTTHNFGDLICTGIHSTEAHTLEMTSRAGLLHTVEAAGDVGDA